MAKKNAVLEGSTSEPVEEASAAPTSTTSNLFPDFDDKGERLNAVPEAPEQEAVKKEEAVAPEVKADPADYLNLEEMSGKKVKTKIDGIDGEVSLEELVKGYQTNKHLSQRGQELGAQRLAITEQQKRIDETLAKVEGGTIPQAQIPTAPLGFDPEMLDDTSKAAFAMQANQIQALTDTVNTFATSMQGVQVDQQLKQIDSVLKAENPEFHDFMAKIPEIENAILSMAPEMQAEYGTSVGYMNIYKSLKFQEVQGGKSGVDERATVTLTPIESGSGLATGADTSNNAEYQKQFGNLKDAAARQDIRDWNGGNPLEEAAKLLTMKGY